jgi:DNA-binding transcriptional ArsR family regulator
LVFLIHVKTTELLKGFSELNPIVFPIQNIWNRKCESEYSNNLFITTLRIGVAKKFPFYAERYEMSASARPMKYLLGWLIAGTRGGVTRAQIIKALKETPLNANQLANLLKMDYRTIRHHLEVLQKNRIITSAGDRYGITYFLSPEMEENYAFFEEIWNKIWEKEKRKENK